MPSEAKTVLIVDDEPDMREFVQVALEDDGYRFVTATDGAAALALVAEEQPALIVMDVQMPKKDGLTTLYDLRQDAAAKSIPVILLTGVSEKTGVRFTAESVEEYMGERPDAYFDKPVDPEVLRRAVGELIGRAADSAAS